MQAQIHKKKKTEHKVTLKQQKFTSSTQQVLGIDNAFFPFAPYPEQTILINTLHKAIINRDNALIESPTGTGKTLSVLVATLASLCSMSNIEKMKVSKVYYLTRTHSQITQVVQEMKRIPWYQCRVNIMASREHLCINRNLKQLKGRLLQRGCQEMCKQKMCKFKEQTQENVLPSKQPLTVQQLCEKGNKNRFCPFYYSKMATDKSELTIMPFNYLLDWNMMDHNNFNLNNSIIIFDEAHNVDSLAEEGSSLEIDTDIITQALIEVKNLEQSSKCRYLHKKFESEHDNSDYGCLSQAKCLLMRMSNVLREFHSEKNITGIEQMLQIIGKMTNYVDQGQEFPGIDLNNYEELLFNLDKVKKLFSQKKIESDQFDLFYQTLSRMMKILQSNSSYLQDYYLYAGPKHNKSFSLKLNCLNASFTFQRLAEHKPRSIILCSGTLGPFVIWEKQLGIAFAHKLKIPTFITPNQVCIQVVPNSSDQNNVRYEFSYQNKHRDEQFQALGQELKEIQKIVPNGIIVAFSTYQFMQKAIRYCLSLSKHVFYESKNESIDSIYPKYKEAARSQKGAFLFIVMKGKFAEGMNFNDELCRCLIVVGIPFLPPTDYRVMRKKSYIQGKFGKEEAEQWYYTQTFKTVNQVIGRVIRSKADYGAILLFDHRYTRKDVIKQLPNWVVSNLPTIQFRPTPCEKRLRDFFKSESWLEKGVKKESDVEYGLELEKTELAIESNRNPTLETLLLHETPVKIAKTRAKKILKVEQDPKQTTSFLKLLEQSQKSSQTEESTKEKKKKVGACPWFSIDYFIHGEDSLTKTLKSNNSQSKPKEEARLTITTCAVRHKKYL